MQKADLTSRAVAGFIDLLIVIALARLPDVIGFLAAAGYILVRDGLFDSQSAGKKVIGLRVVPADNAPGKASYRESIIRNTTLAAAFLLFRVPYAGWFLGPLVLGVEALAALGDERSMRVGDLLARTWTVQPADASASMPGPADVTASAPEPAPVPAAEPETATAAHQDDPQGV
ncbi:MAG: RDD family protein [Nitrospirota bacterium]